MSKADLHDRRTRTLKDGSCKAPPDSAPWPTAGALLLVTLLLLACTRWNWREVQSIDDGWAATFPGKVQLSEREVRLPGRSLPMRMQATGVGSALFAIGVIRLPPDLVDDAQGRAALLAWFEDGLVRRFDLRDLQRGQHTLVVPLGRTLHAVSAIDAQASVGAERRAGRIAARLFIVDDRLYQVIALGAESELPPDIRENFLASFRLLPL